MASQLTDTLRSTVGDTARDALKNIGDVRPKRWNPLSRSKPSPLSGAKGVAVGVGLSALAPLAKKGVDAVRSKGGPGVASTVGEKVGDKVKETVSQKVDGGGDEGDGDRGRDGKGGAPGVGKGRRMPVQQSCDVAVPVETAYNQFTQFEEWPNFMHRVTRVTQEDPCTVSFASKIWGVTKQFKADIETQRPDERIKWRVSEGITHTGVATFHELAPRLTRIELNVDVDPGSLIEKFARGARHVKRAVRADLHRFKAFIEMEETETGAWRGRIEDGELVEEHPEDYEPGRGAGRVEDREAEQEPAGQAEEPKQEDEEEKRPRRAQRPRRRTGGQSQDGGEEEEQPPPSPRRPRRRTPSESRDGGESPARSRPRPSGARRPRSAGSS
jgi:uncharacterized membrane protein